MKFIVDSNYFLVGRILQENKMRPPGYQLKYLLKIYISYSINNLKIESSDNKHYLKGLILRAKGFQQSMV